MLHQIAAEAMFMIRERVARVQNDRDLCENAAAICNCKESLLTSSLLTPRWNLNYAQINISPFEPSPEWLRCGYKINTTMAVYCGNHTKSDKS